LLISIGSIVLKWLLSMIGRKPKPIEEEKQRRKFKRYDKAEDVQKDISKLDKKIEKLTTKKCSRRAIHDIAYFNACESARQRLLREQSELIREWERLAGTPYNQRGASPG